MKPNSSTQTQPDDALLEQQLQQLQQEVAQLRQENRGLRQHTNLSSIKHSFLEATAQAANALLTISPLAQAVNTALQILGESLDTDRVNIIETVAPPGDSAFPGWRALEYEWNSPGTVPQYANQKAAQGSFEEIPEIFERLHRGQTMSYLIEEMPEPFRSGQIAIGVKSTYLVPILVEGQWWGVLGLDDCREAKQCSKGELAILKVAADCIGSAIQRDRTQQAVLQAEQERTHSATKHSQELERISTELQQALDRLSESEERYRTLFELSSEGIYRWELEQPISVALPVDEQVEQLYRSLYVAEANAAYAAMYGLPTTEAASGLRLSDAPIATSDKNLEFLRQCIENGYRIRAAESEEVTPGGKQCYFFNNVIGIVRDGHLIGGWGTQLDISELRETQQALLEAEQRRSQELERINAELQQALNRLAESEKRYRTLFELSNEGIVRWEYQQPIPIHLSIDEQLDLCYQSIRIAEMNNAFAEMYGYQKAEDLIGLTPNEFRDRNSDVTQAAMRAWIKNSYTCQRLETEEIDRYGSKRYFLNSAASTIENDCVTSTWISQVDITELRETQQALLQAEQARVAELAKANEALARTSQRLAEQPDLSAFLSHVALEAIAQLDADAAMISMLDEQHQVLRAVAHVEQGRIVSGLGAEMPVNEAEFVNLLLETRKSRYFDLEQEAHLFWPGAIAYHQQRHHQAVIAVPLFAGAEFLGHLGLAFTHTNPINEQSSELLYALAQQAALAIQLTRLAEEAKQAAIAREQEKAAQERAAELAQANEVLARTSSRLAEQPDLSGFLGHIMLEAVAQMGADGGHLTTYDPQQEMISTAVLVEQGKVISSLDFPPNMPISEVGFIQLIRETRQLRYFDLEANFEQDAHLLWQDVGEHHKRRKHVVGIAIPLFIGDEFLGHFGLAFTNKKIINEQNIELLQVLANQAALAIQLTRLAEEAKQAAIAHEQEQAAQERAAELAKANEALKRTVSKLSEQPELDAFLNHVLTEAAEQIGACSNALFLYNAATQTLSMHAICLHGQIADILTDSRLEPYREPIPADISPAWRQICETGWVVAHETDGTDPNSHPQSPSFHRAMGHETVVAVPLVVGGRTIGFMAPCFREWVEPNPEKIELVQSLAHQATLALELTRLAEAAKQAAISREQEKAAQERAAELAKANEALKRSVDVLATETNLNQFIGHVLRLAAEQFNAPLAEYWETTNPNIGRIVGWWGHNQIHGFGQPHNHPASNSGVQVPSYMLEQRQFSDRRKHFVAPFDPTVQPVEGSFLGDPASWYASFGVNWQLNLPLIVGETCFGVLNFWQPSDRPFTEQQIELGYALAQQVTLAIRLSQLAEEAKQAAIAREQEKAAQERADELEKASIALQQTIDAVGQLEHLDALLPEVLGIVVAAFGARSCGYFEHPTDERIYLRYWFHEGAVYKPEQLLTLDDRFALARSLAQGFTVPIEYLGTAHRYRDRAVILDHLNGTCIPEFDAFARQLGWGGELNVPLVCNGIALGALVIYRETPVFTQGEITLAESLGKQIALAMQTSQIAEREREMAIAREQEKAAQERAAELVKANDALRRSIDALTHQPSVDAFLEVTLRAIAEVLEVPSATLWKIEEQLATLQLVYQDGQVLPGEQTNHPNAKTPGQLWNAYNAAGKIYDYPFCHPVDDPASQFTEAQLAMFRQMGVRCVLGAPIVIGDRTVGIITARLTHGMPDPSPLRLELVNALAGQAALALQMSQLATEAQQVALLQERNRLAREIHDTIAQGLTGVIIQLQAAEGPDTSADDREAHIAQALSLAQVSLTEARRSVQALRPLALEETTFPDALSHLVNKMTTSTSLQSTFRIVGTPYPLPVEVETNLLRIAQESVNNTLKHAQASQVRLEVHYQPQQVELRVQDNGKGIGNGKRGIENRESGGYGLVGVRERAQQIGANLTVVSCPGQGTTIVVVRQNHEH